MTSNNSASFGPARGPKAANFIDRSAGRTLRLLTAGKSRQQVALMVRCNERTVGYLFAGYRWSTKIQERCRLLFGQPFIDLWLAPSPLDARLARLNNLLTQTIKEAEQLRAELTAQGDGSGPTHKKAVKEKPSGRSSLPRFGLRDSGTVGLVLLASITMACSVYI